jgi:hypothetical protein
MRLVVTLLLTCAVQAKTATSKRLGKIMIIPITLVPSDCGLQVMFKFPLRTSLAIRAGIKHHSNEDQQFQKTTNEVHTHRL